MEHWHASRAAERTEIAPQLELNRFVRRWHQDNPGGSRVEALQAWRTHRDTPVDSREA